MPLQFGSSGKRNRTIGNALASAEDVRVAGMEGENRMEILGCSLAGRRSAWPQPENPAEAGDLPEAFWRPPVSRSVAPRIGTSPWH
jgi:hypothetical protein